MGLLQNTSRPTLEQDQEWNLADELNMDFSTDSLFDDIPSKAKALRGDEVVQSTGREFNTSAEGSFVPGSAIAPIETPKSRASADSILREREAQLSGNPLDNFQAPPVAKTEESEEEPSAYSTGQSISEGYRMISDIKRMQAGRTGRNAREVAREKALDNQAIGAVYSAMQQHLESKGYDPRLVDMLGTKQGGGFRTAEDIDRLFEIKSKGTTFQDENGEVVVAPDSDWDIVFEADRASRAQSLKSRKSAASDPLKSATEIQNLLSKFTDESGNPLAGKEAIVDGLNSQLDTAIGAPTGVAAYSYRYGRISDRADKLQRAMDTGVALGDITKDQLPQEIARLNQEQVALSAEKAPYFKDRESLAKWLSDSNTRNLPYFTDINGARSLARYNGIDPNTPQVWSPTQSMWVNFSSPEKTQPTPEKPQSEFSEAGQTGQKIRKAGGDLVRAVKGASTDIGEKISNIPAGAANTGASIVEAGAGVFNIPLKIPRASSISESLEKMGLKKYEDGTWGPIKQ
jgi:hypothetical protein